jgi:hypothetical protein
MKKPKRRGLRGPALESAALRELADTNSWREGEPLTWENLASRLGVSRQAIATKDSVKEALHRAQAELKRDPSRAPAAVVRRTYQDQIDDLRRQLAERDRQLNAWIEKWVTVEANCLKYGYKPDLILEALIKPDRTGL